MKTFLIAGIVKIINLISSQASKLQMKVQRLSKDSYILTESSRVHLQANGKWKWKGSLYKEYDIV